MVRTQVQLTDAQLDELRQLSRAHGRSISALVREGVDRLLESAEPADRGERMRRAAASFGRFRSGRGDLSRRHDAGFAEAAGNSR